MTDPTTGSSAGSQPDPNQPDQDEFDQDESYHDQFDPNQPDYVQPVNPADPAYPASDDDNMGDPNADSGIGTESTDSGIGTESADSGIGTESAYSGIATDDPQQPQAPPARGGSSLFPQLPDDPRLIASQERERAASQTASQATSAPPAIDPNTATSVMSSSELRANIEAQANREEPDVRTIPASPTTSPTASPTANPYESDKNWENWTDLETPSQWREGSQDFQDPISSDTIDNRSVQQTATESDAHPGRNVGAAITVGIILGAIFFGALSAGRAVVVVLIAMMLLIGVAEFFGVARTVGYRPATLLGLAGVAGLVGAVYWRGTEAYPIVLGLVAVAGLLWFLVGVEREHPTANFAVTVMGIAWIGGLGSFAALLLQEPNGDALLIAVVIGTVSYDVLGYVIGSTTGQTRLAYRVSPNKTVEGLIGGMVLSVAITTLVLFTVPGIFPFTDNVLNAGWVAISIAIAAPIGDLCQSLIKRDMQVKDMGTVLPGHGGVLDRFDALLFALPVVYYVSDFVLI